MKINVVMVVLLLAGGTAGAQSPRAFIRDLRGTVEVKAPGSAVWQAAVIGQELAGETMVSTGFKSSALISLGESTLTVRPLTRLSLGELRAAAEAERVEVRLRAGRVRAEVKAPPGGKVDFTVRSPTATASVRGTVFDFDTLNLRVDEGTVVFSGADNTAVYVAAGQASFPDPVSGKTSAPVESAAVRAPLPPAGIDAITGAPATVIGPASPSPPSVPSPASPPVSPPVPDPVPPSVPDPTPDPVPDSPVNVGIGLEWE